MRQSRYASVSSRPRRVATATASARPEAPSLASRFDTCTLAVFSRDEELLADLPVGQAARRRARSTSRSRGGQHARPTPRHGTRPPGSSRPRRASASSGLAQRRRAEPDGGLVAPRPTSARRAVPVAAPQQRLGQPPPAARHLVAVPAVERLDGGPPQLRVVERRSAGTHSASAGPARPGPPDPSSPPRPAPLRASRPSPRPAARSTRRGGGGRVVARAAAPLGPRRPAPPAPARPARCRRG